MTVPYETLFIKRSGSKFLRMVKWVTNAAVRNAHSHYMVHGFDSYLKESLEGKGFPKVMPGVTRALKQQ
jgi:hypothetical protein